MSNITAYFRTHDAQISQSPNPRDPSLTSEEALQVENGEAHYHAARSYIQPQQSSLPTYNPVHMHASNPNLSLSTSNPSSSSGHPSFTPWSTNPPIDSNTFLGSDDLTVSPKEAFLDYDNVSNILEEEANRRASLSNASGIPNSVNPQYPTPLHGSSYLPERILSRSPLPSSINCSMESNSKLQRKGNLMSHSKQTSIETVASFDLPPHCVPKNAIRWMSATSSSRPSLIGCNEARSDAEASKCINPQDQFKSLTGIKSTSRGEGSLSIEPFNLQCDISQKDLSTVYAAPTLPNMLTNCADDFSSTSEEDLTRPPSPNPQSLDQVSNICDGHDQSSILNLHPDFNDPQFPETKIQSCLVSSPENNNHDRESIFNEILQTENESDTVGHDSYIRKDTNQKIFVISQGKNGEKSPFEENPSDDTLRTQTLVESSHLESLKASTEISSSDELNHKNKDRNNSNDSLRVELSRGKRSMVASNPTTSRKRKGPPRLARKISLRGRKSSKEDFSDSWSDHGHDEATSKSSQDPPSDSHSFSMSQKEDLDHSSSTEGKSYAIKPKGLTSAFDDESNQISDRGGIRSSRAKATSRSKKLVTSDAVKPVNRHKRTSTSSAPKRSVRGQSSYKIDQPQYDGIRCEHIDEASGIPCNTVFRRPYDLARHKETIHDLEEAGSGRKPQWICKECEGCFSRKDALIRHCRIRNHQS